MSYRAEGSQLPFAEIKVYVTKICFWSIQQFHWQAVFRINLNSRWLGEVKVGLQGQRDLLTFDFVLIADKLSETVNQLIFVPDIEDWLARRT